MYFIVISYKSSLTENWKIIGTWKFLLKNKNNYPSYSKFENKNRSVIQNISFWSLISFLSQLPFSRKISNYELLEDLGH